MTYLCNAHGNREAALLELEVERATSRLEAYLDEHYGPLWGGANTIEFERLCSELTAAYDAADTPDDDRRVDV